MYTKVSFWVPQKGKKLNDSLSFYCKSTQAYNAVREKCTVRTLIALIEIKFSSLLFHYAPLLRNSRSGEN